MNNNTISFTALCNEYCGYMADALSYTPRDFVGAMLRLLPRIYICARDLEEPLTPGEEEGWLNSSLTEEEYTVVMNSVSGLLGNNDVYLEVFEEDMKYSDTPVAASISENLTDIYQALYDYCATVRYATDDVTSLAVMAVKESFSEYWSSALCNVLRALNHIWVNNLFDEEGSDSDNGITG